MTDHVVMTGWMQPGGGEIKRYTDVEKENDFPYVSTADKLDN